MERVLLPRPLGGTIPAVASKSMAHRLLLCAALSARPCRVDCATRSADIDATVRCLRALGAEIRDDGAGFDVTPLRRDAVPAGAALDCGESGSTLRFLLPVLGALGAEARLHLAGRLPQRPLSPLYELLVEHGMALGPQGSNPLTVAGRLTGRRFAIDAGVSSQFISGLLFALPLLGGGEVVLTGTVASAGYLDLTAGALRRAGVDVCRTAAGFTVAGDYALPARVRVEGDWSNAAFWLCAGAIGPQPMTVTGLDPSSSQGDRAVVALLRRFGAQVTADGEAVTAAPGPLTGIELDAGPVPDLIPPLAVVAALARGETHIYNAGRLRLKESDRLAAVTALLTGLGAAVEERPDGLVIRGGALHGGHADACGDHRIAMAAAIAACTAGGPVTLAGAEAVEKSYPAFWRDYAALQR